MLTKTWYTPHVFAENVLPALHASRDRRGGGQHLGHGPRSSISYAPSYPVLALEVSVIDPMKRRAEGPCTSEVALSVLDIMASHKDLQSAHAKTKPAGPPPTMNYIIIFDVSQFGSGGG